MKIERVVLGALLVGLICTTSIHANELSELNVLYVGNERSTEYVNFLKEKVAKVEAMDRDGFDVAHAASFDVVLLDWPEGSKGASDLSKLTSPLGERGEWSKPTVLLGSAGLLLAVNWELRGGVGCTCLQPLAYDLREHEVFERPFKIDRSKMVSIPTPSVFREKVHSPEIKVLPLVDDYKKRWRAGWCSYTTSFEQHPEIEFFCGGVNSKTPTAAGFWRQGNLLHFGFEQSPMEMNESGRRLLLNAIAYISRFTEDRPIAATPSGFVQPAARARSTIAKWLLEYPVDFAESLVVPDVWQQLSALKGREEMVKWTDENTRFLRLNSSQLLEIDKDLVSLGVSFEQPEFFVKTLADLSSGDAAAMNRSRRLLERYVPCGPKDADADAWNAWWKENRPFLFASDLGDYRCYIDPLAKKRGVPTSELRGPKRADSQLTSNMKGR